MSEERIGDRITSLTIFGHGAPGVAAFAYKQPKYYSFLWGLDEISKIDANAFSSAIIDLYTCNSATDKDNNGSLGSNLSRQTGSIVFAYRGQSTYVSMNAWEGLGAKINRYMNGFNTNDSKRMPQAGHEAHRIIIIPNYKK